MKKKLLQNFVASAGSTFWATLLQLGSAPILLSIWGLSGYGEWILLSTIPAYLSLSDAGLTASATADMTKAYVKGEKRRVYEVYQGMTHMIRWMGAALGAATLVIGLLLATDASRHLVLAGAILVAYTWLTIWTRMQLSLFRSIDRFATSTIVYDAVQFFEGASVLVIAKLGGGYVGAALGLLVGRSVIFLYQAVGVRTYLADQLSSRLSAGQNWQEVKRLMPNALNALSIPAAFALSSQGIVLILGAAVGSSAAAIFSTVRTAARVSLQLVGIINRATIPMFASSSAAGDTRRAQQIVWLNLAVIGLVLAPMNALFAFYGDVLIRFWTHKEMVIDHRLFALFALAIVINAVWNFSANLLVYKGEGDGLGVRLMLSASGAMLICLVGVRYGGLAAAGIASVMYEVLALIFLSRKAWMLLHLDARAGK